MSSTALITGGSGGIGAELAKLHAALGGNLVLVARSETRLSALKSELEQAYSAKVHVIVKDLSMPGAAAEIFAITEAADIVVDILVNNAGFGGLGRFSERNLEDERAMMQVNMNALVDLTHLYLPGMLERRAGRILQVASTAGMIPGPLQAIYFATKAFVVSFSQALWEELRGSGVSCTALCPGAVDTGFAEASGLQDSVLYEKPGASAASVAKIGYDAMLRGDLVTINDPRIRFAMAWIIPLLPRKMVLKISRNSMEKVS